MKHFFPFFCAFFLALQINAQAPYNSIDQLNDVDANGVALSLGVQSEIRGITQCLDFRGGAGYQFILAEYDNVGIQIFSTTDVDNYSFTEGDSLHIWGTVSQFNGLLQFNPDSIVLISQGNPTISPAMTVTQVSESTENKFIELRNMHVVNPSDWTGTGAGFNILITSGSTDTILMRVDNDSPLYSQPAPTGNFHVTGWGSQFDFSNPYTQFYQLLPCGLNSITPVFQDDVSPSFSGVNNAYCNVSTISGSLIISNLSASTVTNVPYTVTAGGTTIAAGSVPSIAAGATATIPVGPVPVTTTGTVTVVATTSLSTDANSANNTASMVIYISNTDASAATTTPVSCNTGSNGAATAAGTNGIGAYSFLWAANAANQTTAMATGLAAGIYAVTVTDSTGCADMASVTIVEPSALVMTVDGTIDASCNGSSNGSISISVSGATPSYSFFWSNGSTVEDVTGLAAGPYTVTVIDANSCSTVSNTITINEPTGLSVTNIFPTNASCNGLSDGAVNITVSGGTPGYNFLWSNGATTEDITGIPAGTYGATISDANGCATILSPFPINEPTAISITTDSISNILCFNDADGIIQISVAAGAGAPYSFLWSNAATTEDLSGLPAGPYTVTVTDANGCALTSNILTVTGPSAIAVSTVNNGNGTATVSATGGTAPYSFLWGTGETTATISATGVQTVTVTDNNGCSSVDSIDMLVAINRLANEATINMYPNPTSANVFLSFDLTTAQDIQIQVVNMAGQVVITQSFSNIQNDKVELMTAELPTGMYIVHAILGQERIARKLVVTRP